MDASVADGSLDSGKFNAVAAQAAAAVKADAAVKDPEPEEHVSDAGPAVDQEASIVESLVSELSESSFQDRGDETSGSVEVETFDQSGGMPLDASVADGSLEAVPELSRLEPEPESEPESEEPVPVVQPESEPEPGVEENEGTTNQDTYEPDNDEAAWHEPAPDEEQNFDQQSYGMEVLQRVGAYVMREKSEQLGLSILGWFSPVTAGVAKMTL